MLRPGGIATKTAKSLSSGVITKDDMLRRCNGDKFLWEVVCGSK